VETEYDVGCATASDGKPERNKMRNVICHSFRWNP